MNKPHVYSGSKTMIVVSQNWMCTQKRNQSFCMKSYITWSQWSY